MDFAAFKRLVEDNFGPADTGLLGEFVSTVEGLVQGGRDLFTAVYDTAQEMRDTLLDLQHLREDFADADLDDDDDELQDDVCDNCQSSGVLVEQTCPLCGKTLCAECAALNDGYCAECADEDEDNFCPGCGVPIGEDHEADCLEAAAEERSAEVDHAAH